MQYIYTLVSDNPAGKKIHHPSVLNSLKIGELTWGNYHCFWDQSLLFSSLINFKLPAGLLGAKHHKKIINKFYPLQGSLDLHTSLISQPKEINRIVQRHI